MSESIMGLITKEKSFALSSELLGICFWREGFEVAVEWIGEG